MKSLERLLSSAMGQKLALCNGRLRLDFRYTLLATKLAALQHVAIGHVRTHAPQQNCRTRSPPRRAMAAIAGS